MVAIGKQAFYTQIDLDQAKAYAYAKEVMSMNAGALDAQEGISAFLGKRSPCWTEMRCARITNITKCHTRTGRGVRDAIGDR